MAAGPVGGARNPQSPAVAVGCLVAAVLVVRFAAPSCSISWSHAGPFVLLVFAIAFASRPSPLPRAVGSALIIGAFAAGVICHGTNQFDTIEHEGRPVASIFHTHLFRQRWRVGKPGLLNPAARVPRASRHCRGADLHWPSSGNGAGWPRPGSSSAAWWWRGNGAAGRGRPDLRGHRPRSGC